MKRFLLFPRLLLLVSLLALGACEKKTDTPAPTPADKPAALLVGRWELVKSSGGIAGGTYPADPARKQEIIFDANNTATYLLNGTVTSTSVYALAPGTSFLTGQPATFLHQGGNRIHQLLGQLSTTTLVLVDDANDGMTYTYTRH